jgi:hypothetical protein
VFWSRAVCSGSRELASLKNSFLCVLYFSVLTLSFTKSCIRCFDTRTCWTPTIGKFAGQVPVRSLGSRITKIRLVPGLGELWKSGGKPSEINWKTFAQLKRLKSVDLLTYMCVLNQNVECVCCIRRCMKVIVSVCKTCTEKVWRMLLQFYDLRFSERCLCLWGSP